MVARACEWPPKAAARRTREGVANEVSDEAGEARGAVAVLCGVGHKRGSRENEARRLKHRRPRTEWTVEERSEPREFPRLGL